MTTPTRTPRQREIMKAAAELFVRRGYHDVGINDISGELGLTGPAFYRHFDSKLTLLTALLDEAIVVHLEEVRDLVRGSKDDQLILEKMIGHHIDFSFDYANAIALWRTEFRVLAPDDGKRLRYLQRLYLEEWVRVLRRLRPDDEVESIRARVRGTVALMQSASRHNMPLGREDLGPLLASMALISLLGH